MWPFGHAIPVWRRWRRCYRGRGAGAAPWRSRRGEINWRRMPMPFVRGDLKRGLIAGAAALAALSLAACSSGPRFLGGGGDKIERPEGSISVNGYLWRATLDTLSFMPLASADPYGGVVITDWYINPEKPDERFKCTVYILDARLRADGLNVAVFKQTRDAAGNWVDAPAAVQTEADIENAILTRARQLRLSNIRG
ncbi:conserved hypothetical protein [Phenylobacterium zucineum HLK1]|uniref:DUF3576 domain-containing protein n=2 Tax=Phenylobacterium zucineum TaxID=284016 RepID=B4RCZ3_PHEZH|nr:conserved hypothetical protein [Phenylobacterium zucineum HLK1]